MEKAAAPARRAVHPDIAAHGPDDLAGDGRVQVLQAVPVEGGHLVEFQREKLRRAGLHQDLQFLLQPRPLGPEGCESALLVGGTIRENLDLPLGIRRREEHSAQYRFDQQSRRQEQDGPEFGVGS
jgi:hypothetical protein